ncbi:hypothetical protein [Klenkia sp. PcliD-1-E]|uniref:hypothetical protein n=1 Tax=Klenkia sp. PcliD-1-E TaxID=2954492 RepID=UPI0020971583|nr:hypothetical protein [Klenkia sp. PcliD-1-E]MCO7218484.1 hypothetical protein [Klenkia sp. PcliD-1-E]
MHESLCVIDRERAQALSDAIARVKECTTVGQAMDLNRELKATWVPGAPESVEEMEDEDLSPESPYSWNDTGAVQDGDWPPMPTALTLDLFAEADDEAWAALGSPPVGARRVTTTLNGDYLEIDPAREQVLVDALEGLGIEAVRDDALIASLSGE